MEIDAVKYLVQLVIERPGGQMETFSINSIINGTLVIGVKKDD